MAKWHVFHHFFIDQYLVLTSIIETKKWTNKCQERIFTWILRCERCCLREITVPLISTKRLVVKIHYKGSMGCYRVGFKTCSTWLYWPTIYALATCIVNIVLQLSIRDSCLRNTPSSRSDRCWSNWASWWWILKIIQTSYQLSFYETNI